MPKPFFIHRRFFQDTFSQDASKPVVTSFCLSRRSFYVGAALALLSPLAPLTIFSAHAQTTLPPPPASAPPIPPEAGEAALSPVQRIQRAYERGRPDVTAALAEVNEALKVNDKDPAILNWQGFLLLRQGKPAEAVVPLSRAVELGADAPDIYTNLGTALLLKPDATPAETAQAVTVLEKAVAGNTTSFEALSNLAYAYQKAGKYAEAAAAYEKAIALPSPPDRPIAPAQIQNLRRLRGLALQKSGKSDEAAAALRELLTSFPDDFEALCLLGSIELSQGQLEQAAKDLEQARTIGGDKISGQAGVIALSNSGIAYAGLGRLVEAGRAYGLAADLAESMSPPATLPRLLQGQMLARAEKWDEAAEADVKVLQFEPQNYDALLHLGTVRLRQGRMADAITSLRAATVRKPEMAEAWAGLAAAYDQSLHYKEAVSTWKKAVLLDPHNRLYAQGYRTALEHSGATDPLIQIARAEMETNSAAAPLNRLGTAYYRKAEQEKDAVKKQQALLQAMKALETAVRRDPKSAMIWNNLGVVYEKRGQIALAINAYKKAVRLNPNFTLARTNLLRFVPDYTDTTALAPERQASLANKKIPIKQKKLVKPATSPIKSPVKTKMPSDKARP